MARIDRTADNVTIIDVAREAGVSYATVSRVINNKAHVKPAKREAVLSAMSRLGYIVNQQARSLAGGHSGVIGLLVQNLGSGWVGAIMRGVGEELDTQGYDMMLYTTHRAKAREVAHVAAITRGVADGLLLILPRDTGSYLDTLRRRQFPYVVIDPQEVDENTLTVGVTNREGAHSAMRYLIELGHRRIGFITGDLDLVAARERLASYRAALAEYGITPRPELIVEGNFLQKRGFIAAQELLDLPECPTAIFAANDVTAFGVIEAARDRGLRIPEDLSVIGFDDIPEASNVHPPLTTVRQPLDQMGRVGARMLLRAIKHPEIEMKSTILPTELIIRSSCQPRRA